MKPATFSVKNSLFVNLISIIILIVGTYYWFHIKKEAFPNISMDFVQVTTAYRGATPQEIEKLITIPLEEELIEVDDIDEITSISAEGFSNIFLELDPNAKDKEKIIQDIQRAVDRERDLPSDIEDDPLVTEIETKNVPVIQVSLSGLPEHELRTFADALKDKLQDIKGVASIKKNGWNDREFRIEVDPKKVDEYYLSLEEIISALKKKNLNLPGGTIKEGSHEYLIRTIGEFETVEEINNVIIRANESGNWIKVQDIARVSDTFKDDDILFKTNGKVAINLIVIKRESADTIKLVKNVEGVIKDFALASPPELKIETFDDISFYIKRRLNVLVSNGIIGLIFIVLCLLFFLQTRVALLTALGLPVAFCTTLIIMAWLGISINLISMFGMIIVLGMLVDDGIIISENSYRYIEKGMAPYEAAIKGTNEVTSPVIATILTTVAFFAPLFMMSGIMGKYVRNIPQVVIIMLGASLIEALLILPSHIADFAKHVSPEKKKTRLGDRLFNYLVTLYERLITFVVSHRYWILATVIAVSIIAVILLTTCMKFVLFSAQGIEQFDIFIEAPMGTHLDETNKRVEAVEDIVKTLPDTELDNFVTTIGKTGREMEEQETGSHLAHIQVFLTPESHRVRKTPEILTELRQKAATIQNLDKLTFQEIKPGPPVGKPIAIKVRGDHFDTLKPISLKIQEYLKTIDGVLDIRDDFTGGKDELRVIVDHEKATQLFLTITDIALAVRHGFEGSIATVVKTTDEEIDVIVQFPEDEARSMDSFNSILIPNKNGKLIPLNKVATLKIESGLSSIKHLDRKRVITISSNVDEKIITSTEVNRQVANHFKEMSKEFVGVTMTFAGEQEDTQESMASLATAFVWGLLIVFLILSSTFGSLVVPAIILVSVPMGLVGVVYVFFLHGQPFGFMSIMGAVGLAGVAVNDAIVLVEFINQLRKEGVSRRESIIQGGKLRLRPVLLTTITTVVGLMPVAYGWGGSDPIIKPMALALGWGLTFATLSTLIVIPIIYAIIDDMPPWARVLFVPIFFWPLVLIGGKEYLKLYKEEIH
jgi:multidrug efflux pump subunit AcrB